MGIYTRWSKPGETTKAPANQYEKMVVDCFLALTARYGEDMTVELRFNHAVDSANRVFDQIAAYRDEAERGIV
jgi:hypothetical protein